MIEFILARWSFPSLYHWLLIFPLSLIAGSVLGWLAGHLKERFRLQTGYSRKIFHFFIFSLAAAAGLLGGFPAAQVYGVAVGLVVIYAVIKGPKSRLYTAMARPTDAPYERYYIIIPLLMTGLGGMASNILFGKLAVIGYITTGWGDAVGEPVGTAWGRHKYRVPTLTGIKCYRSLEGSLAVFIASFTGCIVVLLAGFSLSPAHVMILAFCVSIAAVLVEAFTFHSLDNLTIQICSTGTAVFLTKALNIPI
jgi:phytol kinase